MQAPISAPTPPPIATQKKVTAINMSTSKGLGMPGIAINPTTIIQSDATKARPAPITAKRRVIRFSRGSKPTPILEQADMPVLSKDEALFSQKLRDAKRK